jgi:hypothetical protein
MKNENNLKRSRCRRPHSGRHWLWFFLVLPSAFCLRAPGQEYSIDWYQVAGGGGTSTGGAYALSGTIGQPDAGATMNGGNYSLTGGFWSLVGALSGPGPTLTVTHSGNSVIISWPYPSSGFALQQNSNLSNPTGWSAYAGAVNTNNGLNSITISAPATGNLFFRLWYP